MQRTARAFTTVGLALTLSVAAGAGIAGAQEMEHGRTRPASRYVEPVQSNQVKTQDAILTGYAGNVRG